MKNIFILSILVLSSTMAICQEATRPAIGQIDYLKKSKAQKKTASVIVGSGACLIVTGVVIPKGDKTGSTYSFDKGHENGAVKSLAILTGVLVSLSSILFIISSGLNERKSLRVTTSIKHERHELVKSWKMEKQHYPALSVKLQL